MTYLLSSAGALITDRNTWHTRSDQAWGSSRVWNSGSSFETDSANNAASSTTWQGRANNAWGTSRVWNSGESWEQAYTRVLPPAVAVVRTNTNAGVSGSTSGTLCSLTTDRAGYWMCSFKGAWSGNASDGPVTTTLTLAGVGAVDAQTGDAAGSGNSSWPMSLTDVTPRNVGSGATVTVTYSLAGGTLSGTLYAVFVPTAGAAH
jgi:hypothetical protein